VGVDEKRKKMIKTKERLKKFWGKNDSKIKQRKTKETHKNNNQNDERIN
jgi:hypothetical protein